jgi:hypothetical protein
MQLRVLLDAYAPSLDRTRAECRPRSRYRVNPSANDDLDDTSSLLQSRRGSHEIRTAAIEGGHAEGEADCRLPSRGDTAGDS